MQLSQEQIAAILKDATPNIIEGLKEEVKKAVQWQLQDTASRLCKTEVEEWMKQEIVPEIRKTLVENKDGLVSLAIAATQEINRALAESMGAELKKKLESQWERKKVFEALFT